MDSRVILLLACTVLLLQSAFLQPASGQLEPPTTIDFERGNTSRMTQNINAPVGGPFGEVSLSGWPLAGNASYLNMVSRYDPSNASDPGPYCTLEVVPRTTLLNNLTTAIIARWTKPCPRAPTPVTPDAEGNLEFWCEFEFATDGNLILRAGGTGLANGTELWSSNTAGLDVQRVSMGDGTGEDGEWGSLVLYNSSNSIVWGNVLSNPVGEDFSCFDS